MRYTMGSEDLISNVLLKKELTFILRSDIKLKILINLYKKSSTIKELSETGLNYGSVSTNIKQLESQGFVTKKENEYILTNSMKQKLVNLLYLNQIINNLDSERDYLNNHLVKSDKLDILSLLPLAQEYEIINNTPINPYRVVNNFSKNMAEEKKVNCIFTHVHPEFQKVNKNDSKQKTELNILVAKDIKEYLIDNKKQYEKENKLVNRTIKVKSIDPIKLSLVISEKEVMFVLYNKDGTYDTNAAIISNNSELIKWGNKLFDEISSESDDEFTTLNSI